VTFLCQYTLYIGKKILSPSDSLAAKDSPGHLESVAPHFVTGEVVVTRPSFNTSVPWVSLGIMSPYFPN
jgi:hypothetical protein